MNTLTAICLPRKGNRLLRYAAALALLAGAQNVYADCTGPTPASFTASAPSGTYTVPRDAANGTRLTGWTQWQGPYDVWTCTKAKAERSAVYLQTARSGTPMVVDGKEYLVFPTNLAGIGLIGEFSTRAVNPGSSNIEYGTFPKALRWTYWLNDFEIYTHDRGVTEKYSGGTRYAYVKTGPVTAGVVQASGLIARADIGLGLGAQGKVHQISLAGAATFLVPTCDTPDVTVQLGQHMDSDFPNVGSRRGLNGAHSDFDIGLLNCTGGMTSVSYSLRPLNGVVSGSPGLINTTASSTARGVAVMIADRSNNPATYNAKRAVSLAGYNKATGGNLSIPLRAWIQRTGGSNFSGGSVQAQVEFTMTYE